MQTSLSCNSWQPICWKPLLVCLAVILSHGWLSASAQDLLPAAKGRAMYSLFERGTLTASSDIRAENSRSDSIDILHYTIDLSITDFIGKVIKGHCEVRFQSRIDQINYIDLDLLGMSIDSVTQDDTTLAYTYTNSLLRVYLLQELNTDDSSAVTVYYHGIPQGDVTGWGGFYFTSEYAYNLGVGFGADPHPFGRVWFPCFDNFVERSTYSFAITTAGTKMALCNGNLISSVEHIDGTKTWNWEMQQSIPTYLACVAVGSYAPAYSQYEGLEAVIPIMLGAVAADTTKMKNSFIHLPDALATFENSFGPYRWSKVGFSLVPFSSGAMEHATNIAYPVFMANGTLAWESFLVHELSHHWFGDLVTCRTEEDMWLNEGWAAYCERLFMESAYGKESYDVSIADNHAEVVHYAHTTVGDGAYLPVSGISHEHTYGMTVYQKGADMVHTLRSYMGDSLFFHCVRNYLEAYAFKDAGSEDLRDYLSDCSGINLYHFFNDWIFNPGFPQFSIDSFRVVPAGSQFSVTLFIKQRLNHAPHYYQQVPLEVTFMDPNWNSQTETVKMNGQCGFFTIMLPFSPVYAGLDHAGKISDAITSGMKVISSTGLHNFDNGAATMNVSALTDSAWIRVEHNYAPPDPFKSPQTGLHLSDYHYWNIDGIIPDGFDATLVINYNGSNFSNGGFQDNTLITNVEDSLLVMYRSGAEGDWSAVTDVVQNFTGSHNDKRGYFTVNHVEKGEYVFAIYDYDKTDTLIYPPGEPCQFLSAPAVSVHAEEPFHVFPNPADEQITIFAELHGRNHLVEVYDLYGRLFYHEQLQNSIGPVNIAITHWPSGPYLVCITDSETHSLNSRLIIVN